jgi:hypothetical protein
MVACGDKILVSVLMFAHMQLIITLFSTLYISITESVYDKADALAQDQQQDVKLARKGEAVLENDKWQANDELVS